MSTVTAGCFLYCASKPNIAQLRDTELSHFDSLLIVLEYFYPAREDVSFYSVQ